MTANASRNLANAVPLSAQQYDLLALGEGKTGGDQFEADIAHRQLAQTIGLP